MKVAIVHDWLTGMRGGEYVLEAIAELFPRAELFTLLYVPGKISPILTTLKRHTSLLQKIPGAERKYRHFLPIMPALIERFDLSEFDLVISSSHCVAKGVRKRPDSVHVSYVHAPMRYMWERYDDYFGPSRASLPVRLAARALRPRLQEWDRAVSTPERIDHLIANSRFIANQIASAYGRGAEVIHPFADPSRFSQPRVAGRNYLIVSAFAPYKKLDLAIAAFNQMRLPLLIAGSGQDEKRLKKLAGPTIDFVGALSNAAIADLYAKCRALVFPGIEDFGITPVEAMAAGTPVIAYADGGALETVTEKTGLFFAPQSVDAFVAAVMRLESGAVNFLEADCRARAAEFTRAKFQTKFVVALKNAWKRAGKEDGKLEEALSHSWIAR